MFPCPGYCKYCCYEHRDAFIFLSYSFVQIYAKGVRLLDHTTNLVLGLWGTYGLKLNIQKTKIMASSPITSWQIDGKAMEAVTDFISLGSKITADSDCSHKIKRCLFFGTNAMTNLYSVWKHRNITLLQKVHIVKAMVFLVVMYRCQSWTIEKAEHWRIYAFEPWCWRRLGLESPLDCKEIQPVHPKGYQSGTFIGRTDT